MTLIFGVSSRLDSNSIRRINGRPVRVFRAPPAPHEQVSSGRNTSLGNRCGMSPKPRHLLTPAIAVTCALALSACERKPPQPDPADIQTARQAAAALEARFRSDILERIDRGEDPAGVFIAYRENAETMTAETAKLFSIDLKRTSQRLSNRDNAPDDWELKQLDNFQFADEAGLDLATMDVAEIVTEGEDRYFRWMKPITVTETCLVCHGEQVPVPILRLFAQDYPENEATGYFEYELRGAYSVKKKLPPLPGRKPKKPAATPSPSQPSPD